MTKKKISTIIVSLSMISMLTASTLYYGGRHHAYATAGAEIKEQFLMMEEGKAGESSFGDVPERRDKPNRFKAPDGFSSSKSNPFISDAAEKPNWGDLEVSERKALSDIPKDQLSGMSTDDLILSVLNYDFFGNLFVFDSPQQGFENILQEYRGMQALFERPDAASRLLALYQAIDLQTWYETDNFAPIRKIYLETLLSQDEILGSLTQQEAQLLIQACFDKALVIKEMPEIYSASSTLLLGLRCLYQHDEQARKIIDQSDGLKEYLETSVCSLDDLTDAQVGELALYLQEHYLQAEAT